MIYENFKQILDKAKEHYMFACCNPDCVYLPIEALERLLEYTHIDHANLIRREMQNGMSETNATLAYIKTQRTIQETIVNICYR